MYLWQTLVLLGVAILQEYDPVFIIPIFMAIITTRYLSDVKKTLMKLSSMPYSRLQTHEYGMMVITSYQAAYYGITSSYSISTTSALLQIFERSNIVKGGTENTKDITNKMT